MTKNGHNLFDMQIEYKSSLATFYGECLNNMTIDKQ